MHDPLCRSRNVDGFPCYTCDLIARVREACSKECGHDHSG